ncbi:unnamed protein product [Caenorhabditis bovis]|uniref:Uncharacterized protein n=1 Tax=Caenorhabditis bovis TaxID=2654633 RepID=A0A8S1EFX6_9PELO|nr:unnamed protein product [Caenorhabditis bovis]
MSRQVPAIRKKEIIYRRSYINEINDRFDQEFEKPFVVVRREVERPPSVLVSNYYPPSSDQLARVNTKLDDILYYLRNVSPAIVNDVDEKNLPTGMRITRLNDKVERLSTNQKNLETAFQELTLNQESIDKLLQLVNDTRMDLEEKINNIKQLGDSSLICLDQKLDDLQQDQHETHQQLKDLMHILSNLSSRSSSVNERHYGSRPSSKASSVGKGFTVKTTPKSPPPLPTDHNLKSRTPTPPVTKNDISSKKLKPASKAPSVDVLKRQPDFEQIPLRKH